MTVYAAWPWRTNAELIAYGAVPLGYLRRDWPTRDPTHGSHGVWWKLWRPDDLEAHDLKTTGLDFRAMPPEWKRRFKAVTYDAPYKMNGKATPAAVRSTARDLAGKHAGSVTYTYTAATRGFAATMTEAQAKRLAADPRVASVTQDGVVSLAATQSPVTWGLDRIDQRALPLSNSYTYTTTASNVHAYIIDTGIRTAHTDFGGRARTLLIKG